MARSRVRMVRVTINSVVNADVAEGRVPADEVVARQHQR